MGSPWSETAGIGGRSLLSFLRCLSDKAIVYYVYSSLYYLHHTCTSAFFGGVDGYTIIVAVCHAKSYSLYV